jgi:type I restriction-modification system DNA methylase subunit
MSTITINEIRRRLQEFAVEHANDTDEKQHEQQFWRDFYSCFGISKSSAVMFQARVIKVGGVRGYIDSFIPGVLLVEQKSLGRNLDDAYVQAQAYFHAITNEFEKPKYIITCDFQTFHLYDLKNNAREPLVCKLNELSKRADWFMFLVEKEVHAVSEELPVNRKAAEQIAKLHDALLRANYKGKDLEVFLTRLLFCLFADDTGIFGDDGQFRRLVEKTREDGSDLGSAIALLFQVLNTPPQDRQTTLDEALQAFEYVNGSLFEEQIQIPFFNFDLRTILLNCVQLDWSGISPAIFGAMFQAVLEDGAVDTTHRRESRRELGAHYTSERNILKVIEPLFLEQLHNEFIKAKGSESKLLALYNKLPTLKFFDPACGCGNFLVIAYRELRRLENDVISELLKINEDKKKSNFKGGLLDIETLCRVNVGQFYGIEIDGAATHIARVAMYITDHQLNLDSANLFGKTRATVPLVTTPHIHNANALQIDWNDVIKAKDCSYVFGNPPFIGKKEQTTEQKKELISVAKSIKGSGVLDYVCCWYLLAGEYLKLNNGIHCAFVSTNSITQGEQVGILWGYLNSSGISIDFAHRTFKWSNEGRGVAAVHCVIIGFSINNANKKKELYYYANEDDANSETLHIVDSINPYLVNAPFVAISKRSNPICNVTEMNYGSMPIDNNFFTLTSEERDAFIAENAENEKVIKKYIGGNEFINSIERYCLWLVDADPNLINRSKLIKQRIEAVRQFRLDSEREATNKLAIYPMLFGEIRQPKSNYLVLPKVSSQNRSYMPIGFVDSSVIVSGSALVIPNASLYEFGVLQSKMHMAWMRTVCGRMKSDYQYSASIVYNNYVWASNVSDSTRSLVENNAKCIIDLRKTFNATFATLYNNSTSPPSLIKAHIELDKAVDKAYGYTGADDDASRAAFLFKKYEELTSILPSPIAKKKRVKKSTTNDMFN